MPTQNLFHATFNPLFCLLSPFSLFSYIHIQGANRFATILFYLSDVKAGGETVFPRGNAVRDELDCFTTCRRLRGEGTRTHTARRGPECTPAVPFFNPPFNCTPLLLVLSQIATTTSFNETNKNSNF
jgi:hypothetical protein